MRRFIAAILVFSLLGAAPVPHTTVGGSVSFDGVYAAANPNYVDTIALSYGRGEIARYHKTSTGHLFSERVAFTYELDGAAVALHFGDSCDTAKAQFDGSLLHLQLGPARVQTFQKATMSDLRTSFKALQPGTVPALQNCGYIGGSPRWHPSDDAIALVYAPFPSAPTRIIRSRYVSARLSLPQRPNSTSYNVSLMVVGTPAFQTTPTTVQIGLAERPEIDRHLHAFIAYTGPRMTYAYHDLGVVTETSHTVAISQDSSGMSFSLDGKTVQSRLMLDLGEPYVRIGGQTATQGNSLSGIVTHVHIGDSIGAYDLTSNNANCLVTMNGGEIRGDGSSFAITGVAERAPLGFLGDCAGLPNPN